MQMVSKLFSNVHQRACVGIPSFVFVGDKVDGVRSTTTVCCTTCSQTATGPTNTEDINVRLCASTLSAGNSGITQRKILSGIGAPALSSRTFSNILSRQMRQVTDTLVQRSLENARAFEKYLVTGSRLGGFVPIAAIIDAVFGKRGYDGNYSSHSGGIALLGQQSGLALEYAVCQNYCQTCKRAQNSGVLPPNHNCPRNFDGSASSK